MKKTITSILLALRILIIMLAVPSCKTYYYDERHKLQKKPIKKKANGCANGMGSPLNIEFKNK